MILLFGSIYWKLLQNGKQIYEVRSLQVTKLVEKNPVFFDNVFTDIFPQALNCKSIPEVNCAQTLRSAFDKRLSEINHGSDANAYFVPDYFGNGSLNLTSKLPMYFIKLEDGKIAKLFFSGDLKLEPVDTAGERKVQEILFGKRKELYGIQANIAGLEMTYLKDFLSEAEVIIPYEKNGEIIGAIVFLHGD